MLKIVVIDYFIENSSIAHLFVSFVFESNKLYIIFVDYFINKLSCCTYLVLIPVRDRYKKYPLYNYL